MKTTEELNAIKEELKALTTKLNELSEEELLQVTGGTGTYRKDIGSDKNAKVIFDLD